LHHASAPLGKGNQQPRAAPDRVCKRRGFARLAVDVNAGDFAGGGNLAGFGVAHFVAEADGFDADLEQLAFHLDDIARQQFTFIADILLNRGHAAAGFAQRSRGQPDPREQIPVGFVEFSHIPHDVHVADGQSLLFLDRGPRKRAQLITKAAEKLVDDPS
jgi:hypothetical protein